MLKVISSYPSFPGIHANSMEVPMKMPNSRNGTRFDVKRRK